MAAKSLYVKLVAQTDSFQKGMNSAAASLSKLKGMIAATGVAFVAFKAAQALTNVAKESMQAIDATGKLSDRLQISTEHLQGMRLQADLAGVSFDDFTAGMTKVQNAVGEALSGTKANADAFRALGISLDEIKSKSPDQQFGMVADALNRVEDANIRVKLSQDIFGKGAASLNAVIRDGSAGLAAAADEAERLGYTFSRVDAAKVEYANDQMTRIGTIFAGIGQRISIELSPYIAALVDGLMAVYEQIGGAKGVTNAIVTFIEFGLHGLAKLADAALGFQQIWAAIKVGIAAVSVAWYTQANAIIVVINAIVDRFRMLYDAWKSEMTAIVETGKLGWLTLKDSIIAVWDGIKAIIGAGLLSVGKALSHLPGSVGASVEAAGRELVDGVRDHAAQAGKELAAQAGVAGEAWRQYGEDLKKVFTSGVEVSDTAATRWSANALKTSEELLTQYRQDLDVLANTELPTNAVDNFLANVRTKAQMVAEEIAKAGKGKADNPISGLADSSGMSDKERDRMASELETLRAHLATKQELELSSHEETQTKLSDLLDAGMINQEDYNNLSEREEERHQKTFQELKSAALQNTQNVFNTMLAMTQGHNRKLFEFSKVAAIANAVVSTYQAAAQALKEVPYPYNFAAAASVVASGLQQVQSIRSTSFGGGGGGRSGGGSAGSVPTPDNSGSTAATAGARDTQAVNVTIVGDSFGPDHIRKFMTGMNEVLGDGFRLNVAGAT